MHQSVNIASQRQIYFWWQPRGLGVNPNNCIGIEDASAGIDSINTASMYSIGVGDSKTLNKAMYIVSNTNELIFKSILKEYSKKQ